MQKILRYIIVSSLACAMLSVPAFAVDDIIDDAETAIDDVVDGAGDAADDLVGDGTGDNNTNGAEDETDLPSATTPATTTQNAGTGNPATGVALGTGAIAALGIGTAAAAASRRKKR